MKLFLLQHHKFIVFVILLLIISSAVAHLIQEGLWANINTQGMIRLSKECWDNGDYNNSIYWYRAAYSNAFVSGLQWEFFRIYDRRTDKLLKQGKLPDALEACKRAAKIWNQEGATGYRCLSIEQQLEEQKP